MSVQNTFTTLRLTNSMRENGGEWYANSITDYHRRVLAEHRGEEPNAGWKLETRGLYRPWQEERLGLFPSGMELHLTRIHTQDTK